MKHNCSSLQKFQICQDTTIKRLRACKYPQWTIEKGIEKTSKIKRETLVKKQHQTEREIHKK